ncbi:hypothetical protein AA0120_g9399 [Alternaria tenuissima]|nr:hypothetical protein AA0120_g9399 [Alternaria tenuissima]RYO45573.1 hypothetical protein AA0116_g13173 [Alternaria tenuissima]
MDLPPANVTPSEHQRRCIERMLQTKKFNIVHNLLAWKIHFAFPDALPYVHVTNSNESLASGLDVFAPFRLYSTFNNDHRDCLASLADVPFHTVERWIRESGASSARLQVASHDANAHAIPAANHSSATERSHFVGPLDSYAYRPPTTTLQPPRKVKVEKGYFKQDCLICFEKGFDPKSQKQLRKHLKMDKHTKEYKLKSTPDGLPDHYSCCNIVFDDGDSWADHVVDCHCHSSDVLAPKTLSHTHPAASLQGVSTPGSSSGRYAGGSSYQGTPGSGVTRNTSFSSTGFRRYSGVSDHYEGSLNAVKVSGSLEDAAAPTSQPRIYLEPPYLLQTVASVNLPNEQLPLAMDVFGNHLFDSNHNNIFRAHDSSLVSGGYAGLIPVLPGHPLFAYEGCGKTHNYQYCIDIW